MKAETIEEAQAEAFAETMLFMAGVATGILITLGLMYLGGWFP